VQVGDEVVRLVAMLQVDVLPYRAEIIAPVKSAGGLDSGENSHEGVRALSKIDFGVLNPNDEARMTKE
jgi:hypothetical protein